MSDNPFPKPDAKTQEHIDRMFRVARQQLVEDGEVSPIFVILHGSNGVDIVSAEIHSPADKGRTALQVRGLVEVCDAHTVVTVMEIWTLPDGIGLEEARALIAQYGSPSRMPQRVEAVRVAIETRDGKMWDAVARIRRNGRAVKLDPPLCRDLSSQDIAGGGRFSGWFAPEKDAPGLA